MTLSWLATVTEAMLALSCVVLVAVHASVQRFHAQRYARKAAGRERPRPRASAYPAVDVIVPCYNERPWLLEACCAALRAQRYPGALRVFLIDDGSQNLPELIDIYRGYGARPGWHLTVLADNRGKRRAQDAAVWRGDGELC
jgi:N-acetylglucosaminyltransferase